MNLSMITQTLENKAGFDMIHSPLYFFLLIVVFCKTIFLLNVHNYSFVIAGTFLNHHPILKS